MRRWQGLRALALAAVMAVGATGCVATPEKHAFNPGDNGALRRIAVLPMRYSEVDLLILNNPGYSFGLIGVGIAEANRAPKRNWLRGQVAGEDFDHVARFRTQFDAAMLARGYELVWPETLAESEKAKTPRETHGTRKTYAARSDVDAQLDVNFGFVGYAAAGSGDNAPYRPTLVLSGRLVSPGGQDVLFADRIIYNNAFGMNDGAIVVLPDDAYRYPDFDDLEAAGVTVVRGLEGAVDTTASTLADQFRRVP